MSKLAHSNQATMDEIEAKDILRRRQEMDDEATAFAMELLMPTKLLREELAKIGTFDIDDELPIKTLASKFKVSQQVMLLRLTSYPR